MSARSRTDAYCRTCGCPFSEDWCTPAECYCDKQPDPYWHALREDYVNEA